METKTADSRGRINLGKEFANRTFLLEKIGETEMRLELAAVIPERELWFFRNPEAQRTVFDAIHRVRAGEFAQSPPDVDEEEPWEKELED
ncbi:MAG: hypothetical protein AB1646_08615 [Thermodesulfobacteriota bacterium]